MLVASDLDRTLFYSSRAILEFGWKSSQSLKPVEDKNNHWVGFMTDRAYLELLELYRHCLFIPITTRTTEQYLRFTLFKNELAPLYAITSNGANILYNGIPLKEWSIFLSKQLRSESAQQGEILSSLKEVGFRLDGQLKQAEDMFFYYILNHLPTASELNELSYLVSKKGWRISKQGRRLYFVPKAIKKGSALTFVCTLLGEEPIAGAGDSLLDWDFLQNCKYRFVPKHGELARVSNYPGLRITEHDGVAAGEEIIREFLSLVALKN